MKRLVILLTLFAIASVARADYEIRLMSSFGKNSPEELVLRLKGSRGRMAFGKGNTKFSIFDNTSGLYQLGDTEKKEVREWNTLATIKSPFAGMTVLTLKPTGKKEKIAGAEAEEYTWQQFGTSMALWVAKDFPKDQAEALLAAQESSNPFFKQMRPEGFTIPGTVVRSVASTGRGEGDVILEIKSITPTTVDDKEFAIPAGYDVKKIPVKPPAVNGAKPFP